MKKTILMLIAITSIACSCKKYEEGPLISFRSAKNRIYGSKFLSKYTVDGLDFLSQIYDSLGLIFNISYNKQFEENLCQMGGYRKDGQSPPDFYWKWELVFDNKIMKNTGTFGDNYGAGIFRQNITPNWEILKLKKNDIKLKTKYNGKEYIIELTY